MRTTFSTALYCRESKVKGNGYAPVELAITINGRRGFLNLPWQAIPKEFNAKRKSPLILRMEREWLTKVDEATMEILSSDIPLTMETLRQYLRTGGAQDYTVEHLFNDYFKILKKRLKVDLTLDTFGKYTRCRDMFYSSFGKDRQVTEITNNAVQLFYTELLSRYQVNTAASYMSKFKTVIHYALDNDKMRINPLQGVKIKKEKKEIEFLTEGEIKTIATATLSTKALERVRDYFIVQCCTGLAFSDLERLRKEDIQNDNGVLYISKCRVKTGVQFTAVILPMAIPILEKYHYHLPIISNQKTNSALKAIARECNIDKNVYSHLGRKSYGTLLLNHNVRMETVAHCLGHSDAKTTAKYYASLSKTSILKEVASIF